MGHKLLKSHFGIEHILHRVEGEWWIGSAYVSRLIQIKPDGTLERGTLEIEGMERLGRYWKEMSADPAVVRLLLFETPDVYAATLPVWTWDRETMEAVELKCEAYGWPNVTHDGKLMYENTFFRTREEAERKAREEMEAEFSLLLDRVQEAERKLAGYVEQLDWVKWWLQGGRCGPRPEWKV